MVGYNNKRKQTIKIGFPLKNESQTMMTFVSKGQSQSLMILQSWTKYMAKMAFYSPSPNINVVCANTPVLREDFPENSNIDIGGGTSVPINRM